MATRSSSFSFGNSAIISAALTKRNYQRPGTYATPGESCEVAFHNFFGRRCSFVSNGRAAFVDLSQPRPAGAGKEWLQRGGLPRSGGWPKWIQAFVARLR